MDENGDLLADSHNVLNRWKNYFSRILNVHNASDVKAEGQPESSRNSLTRARPGNPGGTETKWDTSASGLH
jgi:hypothetical protein